MLAVEDLHRICGRSMKSISIIWPPTHLGDILQVPWTNFYGLGRLLTRVVDQPLEGAEEVVSSDEDLGTGKS